MLLSGELFYINKRVSPKLQKTYQRKNNILKIKENKQIQLLTVKKVNIVKR